MWSLVIVGIVGVVLAYFVGYRRGTTEERFRCHGLCHQAIQRRYSGTTCWVMNAIWSGEESLLSPEEFFGPEGSEK